MQERKEIIPLFTFHYVPGLTITRHVTEIFIFQIKGELILLIFMMLILDSLINYHKDVYDHSSVVFT